MGENIENLKRINITKIVNAGLFFGYEYPYKKISAGKLRLMNIEKKMNDLFKNSNQYFQPEENQFVAVNPVEMTEWFRGYVKRKVQTIDGFEYKILLIDYGQEVKVKSNRLKQLPFEFSIERLESQLLRIILFGIMPTFLEISITAQESKFRKTDYWLPKDELFVKEILKSTNEIYFKEICCHEEFKLGILHLKKENQFISLQNILVEHNHAIEYKNFKNEVSLYIKKLLKYPGSRENFAIRKDLYPSIQFENDTKTESNEYDEINIFKKQRNDSIQSNSESIISTISVKYEKSYSNENEYSETESDIYGSVESVSTKCSEISKNSQLTYKSYFSIEKNNHLIDKILIVGDKNQNIFEPIYSFRNSHLDIKTLQMLEKLKINDLNRCQKYMIPAMLTKKNITLIDGPKTGKTLGALIALVSLLRNTKEKVHHGVGPRSVIICPFSARCEWIQNQCAQIISGNYDHLNDEEDELLLNVAYGCGTELERKKLEELIKGYDILICTPRFLLRLLIKEEAFNFRRLSHIIFDEIHILLNLYYKEILEILKHTKRKPIFPQKVIISNCWSSKLRPIIEESLILISSYLDAGLFLHLKSVWKCICDKSKKIDSVIDIIKNEMKEKSIVIMFNEEDDLHFVFDEIQKTCSRLIYKVENLNYLNIDFVQSWKNNVCNCQFPILLCTDYALPDLHIYEADCLIHYSLPTSKNEFLNRFCVLLNLLQTISDENIKSKSSKSVPTKRPENFIYTSAENIEQFPAILEIMEKLHAEIPLEIKNCVERILRLKEIMKQDICTDLKQFGRCINNYRCEMRHEFLYEKDKPHLDLPKSGFVKVHITHVYSPSHFAARLLEHKSDNGRWEQIKSLSHPGVIALQMKAYFSNPNFVRRLFHPNVGDLAAVELFPETFKRVRILKYKDYFIRIFNDEEIKEPRKVTVIFIDEGNITDLWIKDLIKLPEKFTSIPESIVDIFICNLLPVDEDSSWGEVITKFITNKINQFKENSENFFYGKISLVIGRNLWLHPFECKRWFSSINEFVLQFSIQKTLLGEEMAVRNENHLISLIEKCKLANLYAHDRINEVVSENFMESTHYSSTIFKNSEHKNDSFIKNELSTKLENNNNTLIKEEGNVNILHGQENFESNLIFKKPENLIKKKKIRQNSKPKFKPKVEWRQDLFYVYLIIDLNVELFKVEYNKTSNCIHFRAEMENKIYEFSEILFGCIDNNSSLYHKSGVTIFIKLAKLVKREKWKRLLKSRDQYKWIKTNQNFVGDTEDSSLTELHEIKFSDKISKHPDGCEFLLCASSDSEYEESVADSDDYC